MNYETLLADFARDDDRLVVMTAENRAAIRNLPPILGPRFIDVGIAEQTMIGAAAGLALAGRIPVVHALATFLVLRAFEFIRTDVGIAGLPVKLVGGVPGVLSEANGPTHQAIEDIGILRGIPKMRVVCPSDEVELLSMMPHVIADTAPVYVRYNALPAVVPHHEPFAMGRAEVLSAGKHVTLLTYGVMLREVWAARALLEKQGISARVVNVRSLSPVDERALLDASSGTELVVTVEDHFTKGGLATIFAETLLRFGRTCRFHPFAFDDRWFRPGLLGDVLAYERLDGPGIAGRVSDLLREKNPKPAPFTTEPTA
ncbi:MAG: transketolase [Myxococcales bacterium]|jgi:transketolase|nr:transketolase [Myxococcales bacterium]MBL9108728.1 transketolase [Myxococcales bacterium]